MKVSGEREVDLLEMMEEIKKDSLHWEWDLRRFFKNQILHC